MFIRRMRDKKPKRLPEGRQDAPVTRRAQKVKRAHKLSLNACYDRGRTRATIEVQALFV